MSKELAREIFERRPLRVRFWLWIANNFPFLSEFRRLTIIMNKATPWLMSEAIQTAKRLAEEEVKA